MLDKFRETAITWDKATSRIYSPVTANESDEKGRKLVVKIVNSGQVEDLTGATLHLYWETRDKAHDGLDVFKAVDLKKGEFELSYTTGMLSNRGVLNANLVLIDTIGRVVSERFNITVTEGIDDDAIQSSDSFTALTEALAQVSTINNKADRAELLALESTFEQNKVSVEQQLQQKADKTFVEIELTKKADLDDIGAPTQEQIDDWLGRHPEATTTVADGSLTNSKYADKSVIPSRTSFAKGGGGINLWDGSETNLYPNGNAPNTLMSGTSHLSYIVKIRPLESHIFWKTTDSERFRIATFTAFPKIGDVPIHYFSSDNQSQYVYSPGSSENYALVFVSSVGTRPSEFQVELGVEKTEYIDPDDKIIIPLDEKSIPKIHPGMTTFFTRSKKNLFDGNWTDGYLAGNAPNQVVLGSGKMFIKEINPNSTYTITKSSDTDRLVIGQFDVYPIEGAAPISYYSPGTNKWTFYTVPTAKYIVIVPTTISQSKEPEWFQLEEGSVATDYEAPYTIPSQLLPKAQAYSKSKFIITGNLAAEYSVITESFEMDTNINLDAVYAWFDDLVARRPEVWSRTLFTTESSGLPVYRYDHVPYAIGGGAVDEVPKILHVNGIHGSEKQSLGSGMRFYKDLTDHWEENELLQTLRSNVHFIVIPAFNAYGVKHYTRQNANGVNLNRNFPEAFEINDVPYDSSGPYPLSEVESQALMNLMETEENIIFAIDHHRYNPFAQGNNTIWTGGRNRELNRYLAAWSRDVQADFVKMHPDLAAGKQNLVRVLQDYAESGHGWLSYSFNTMGIPGTILEISLDTELSDYHTKAMAKLFAFALDKFAIDKNVIF